MSSADPGRLRAFVFSRLGIALMGAVVVVAMLVGAIIRRNDGHSELIGGTVPSTENSPSTTAPPAASAGSVLLGVSVSPEERGFDAEKAAVSSLEQTLGRTLDIDHNFYTWDQPFPSEIEPWDLASGRIPLISWNGKNVQTSDIAAGTYDRMIKQRAKAVKALGKPVLIRWFWEMDGNKKASFAGTPDQYIAAWRHIVTTFRNEGANNVSWVWCPNATAFNDGTAQAFYPGPDFVDWMCADGYNWAPGRLGDDWRSFKDIFGGFYSWASQQNKPIMVGEFGAQERNPGDKAQWITDARNAIKNDFPLLKAAVYFSANKDYDWRLTTSDSAMEAFREMALDPWFNLGVNRHLPS